MSDLRDITVLIVNFRTLDLTRGCVETLLAHYPEIQVLLIDNGSGDESTTYLRDVAGRWPNVEAVFNAQNRYHGPAVDQGIRHCTSPYVFTLDSDCAVRNGGFLEAMRALFEDPRLYAVGELRYKSRYGYTFGYGEAARSGRRKRIPYIHPWGMLLDRRKYLTLAPFIHHGSPCLRNMRDARARGYGVRDFPMWDFVEHFGRGTSARHGYGLCAGAKQRLAFWLERLEGLVLRDPTLDPLGGPNARS